MGQELVKFEALAVATVAVKNTEKPIWTANRSIQVQPLKRRVKVRRAPSRWVGGGLV